MAFKTWIKLRYEEKGPAKWLAFFLELIAVIALFGLMLLTCIDVFGRYLFNRPVSGGTELTEIGLAVVIFAVMPVVSWRGGQIVVDLIDLVLKQSIIKYLSLFSAFIISFSLFFIGIRIFELGQRSNKRGITTEFLHIPSGYVIEYIAIMCWLTALSMVTYGVYRILIQEKTKQNNN